MEIFTDEVREGMVNSLISVLLSLLELIGVLARELLNLIVLPVHEFCFTNILTSLTGIAIVTIFTGSLFRFFGSFFR